jgi:hypothetical protein
MENGLYIDQDEAMLLLELISCMYSPSYGFVYDPEFPDDGDEDVNKQVLDNFIKKLQTIRQNYLALNNENQS